jgi:hypothetical protein
MSPNTATCPLCNFDGDGEQLYNHLQVSHRKSALASALVDATSTEQGASAPGQSG